jgi:hypothetical protein
VARWGCYAEFFSIAHDPGMSLSVGVGLFFGIVPIYGLILLPRRRIGFG